MERYGNELFTSELQQRARIIALRGPLETPITDLVYDSRKVTPGALYIALPGLHTDGHRYIPEALQRGARAILHQYPLDTYQDNILYIQAEDSRFAMSPLADAFYGCPSRSLAVIGVTGTEGKSTTVFLIYQLLTLAGKKAGFISTVQYRIGEQEEWNPEHQTTPEAPVIHKYLAAMRDYGMEYAVVESSSHGLSPRTNRLGDVAFDVGVMTNVTHEHLEFHGTWEQYRYDKANLFRALDRYSHEKILGNQTAFPDRPHRPIRVPSFGVVNADDPSASYFAAATERRVYTYSTRGSEADLSIRSLESTAQGNNYEVYSRAEDKTYKIQDNLPGSFNAGNVLASLLVVSGLLGLPLEDFIPLVSQLRPVRGRMTVIQQGQPFEVIIDYAHTPSSFEIVLPPIKKRIEPHGGRLISVFGSGGERDREKRPRQGRIAADWSDIVILTDEDPRGEDPLALLEEIAAGCPERIRDRELFLIPDRPTAIRKAFSLARPGDVVLLLGKGHENSIIYADRVMPYDEIGEARRALEELGYREQSSSS
ncbi:MAG TPA: UDP-N-acetylmuramoyl-L-alanyl-D-glutamate--2,6-diaminopimelate ligase [Termitinemataceae bacterium]|uniref:UDP-N-acetylmuramoyl-L-alanyl-D-glutamate--2, 6-diaminopimelate ligase n=1 Tax=Treponema sp. J25 TaxID=2094121 RepID=UPI00104C5584|nr:UDP-N-acetylmuramoyl-L-alanyl-D-glutamate--2,6-diaminopimelate ligase [Treponema sp. J25]TCW62319.1 UDP-N-acetylmuramoyl-L-alanyl-D-glutamate--2,6-diaminopimelate ligase [Treponema sp. J25]HOJ99364.1 UDP-N-acetylmuramoyl-L-alanyl-D-glutamate--2,6-diaminopimelate ligase [Termitinemataceae bacterium]HOM22495.1 UDP-N-acetylmuramoyl-L-alanyl-D-glutamate--2,6-diaminopimelate ligase [Termitinemataceae bacterium]HPQ00734.1 UDP-N-acetylmuramoyl-L-alanyl-D-glutamate--2,6-diaminopimelate ligase [Termi